MPVSSFFRMLCSEKLLKLFDFSWNIQKIKREAKGDVFEMHCTLTVIF